MLTGHQPWSKVSGNIIYLLGKGQSPPIPEELSDSAKDFIKLCFTSDPEARPTATELCAHGFVDYDPEEFDYHGWHEEACVDAARRCEEESDCESSDSDYSDGYFEMVQEREDGGDTLTGGAGGADSVGEDL